MPEQNISFFSEDCGFALKNQSKHIDWILQSLDKEVYKSDYLNFIFCSDEYLLNINIQYLNHDYYTDIITFDNSEDDKIAGDIFISIDRAAENSKEFSVNLDEEIRRLIIHGTLHLIGYKDGTAEEKKIMRAKEDYYLSLWS